MASSGEAASLNSFPKECPQGGSCSESLGEGSQGPSLVPSETEVIQHHYSGLFTAEPKGPVGKCQVNRHEALRHMLGRRMLFSEAFST